MTVKNYKSGKIISLSSPLDNGSKILYLIYFISFTFIGIGIAYWSLPDSKFTIDLFSFLFFGLSGIALFAGYRFINKALEGEKLIVNKDTLTIFRRGLLVKKADVYQIDKISNFRFLDKQKSAKHPLAGQTFDYLGFQTEQEVIDEMSGNNRLAFDYNHRAIKFGENVYSWDFEKIEAIFTNVTGKDLRN